MGTGHTRENNQLFKGFETQGISLTFGEGRWVQMEFSLMILAQWPMSQSVIPMQWKLNETSGCQAWVSFLSG